MAVVARVSLPRDARLAYRRILVPLALEGGGGAAVSAACRLAADRGATVTALAVVQVPRELPLDAHMVREDEQAKQVLRRAEAIGDSRGVAVAQRVVRARAAGEAIVEAAEEVDAELIVLPARRVPARGRKPVFGKTAQFVLQRTRCRVLLSMEPE